MRKFFVRESIIRDIDIVIYGLAFYIVLVFTNHGLAWDEGRYKKLFYAGIFLLFVKVILTSLTSSKQRDELHRQIDFEVFAKTYSLIIPILFLVGTLILYLLGFDHEARILIIAVGIILYTEKIVRGYIRKKYAVEYTDEENKYK
jgi:L-asparagine transporter-like permease